MTLTTKAAERWSDSVRILLTGYADIESTIAAVNNGKIYSYCSKPWEDEEIKALVAKAIEEKRLREERSQLFEIIHHQNAQLKDLNSNLEAKVEQRTEQLKKSFKQLDNAHKSLKKQYSDSVKTFAKIIEMRPGISNGHATFIADNARRVAIKLGLNEKECTSIIYAGLLLQIGKMSFPDKLLGQAYFLMTHQDRHHYLNHALEGEALLKNMNQLKDAGTLIKYQFEHFDGSGYPEGLHGQSIPKGSQILCVVRDYIAFLEGSMTGKKMSSTDVQQRLENKRGVFYDPEVVAAFLEVLAETKANTIRPIVEISCAQLLPEMEIAEISHGEQIFLKDTILTKKIITDINALREKVGNRLIIKIRLGEEEKPN
ncbi:MAG: two-component system response regulator [Methyloprofundus sp.]|nr:two-component system response regulator [Methyloprofundus sp.]